MSRRCALKLISPRSKIDLGLIIYRNYLIYRIQLNLLGRKKEFGKLLVHLSSNISAGIIELIQKEKVIKALSTNETTSDFIFENLLPGEYSFRIILDENKNEKWDPIDVQQQKQAEDVLYFNTPLKVRANWEVETTLEINK